MQQSAPIHRGICHYKICLSLGQLQGARELTFQVRPDLEDNDWI